LETLESDTTSDEGNTVDVPTLVFPSSKNHFTEGAVWEDILSQCKIHLLNKKCGLL